MKAITIYQPWASLIAIGAKRFETRGWYTKYRGKIAIHAGLKHPYHVLTPGSAATAAICAALDVDLRELPLGAVIATAELVECWEITHSGHVVDGSSAARIENMPVGAKTDIISGKELLFGDWRPGRYALELANVKLLPKPIPARGQQGLWNWDPPTGVAV